MGTAGRTSAAAAAVLALVLLLHASLLAKPAAAQPILCSVAVYYGPSCTNPRTNRFGCISVPELPVRPRGYRVFCPGPMKPVFYSGLGCSGCKVNVPPENCNAVPFKSMRFPRYPPIAEADEQEE